MADKPDKPAESYPSNPWPLLLVAAVLSAGTVYAALGHWKRGALLIAGSLCLGAALRLVLPRATAGLLVIRRRWIDVTVMAGIGLALAAVALIVPPS